MKVARRPGNPEVWVKKQLNDIPVIRLFFRIPFLSDFAICRISVFPNLRFCEFPFFRFTKFLNFRIFGLPNLQIFPFFDFPNFRHSKCPITKIQMFYPSYIWYRTHLKPHDSGDTITIKYKFTVYESSSSGVNEDCDDSVVAGSSIKDGYYILIGISLYFDWIFPLIGSSSTN